MQMSRKLGGSIDEPECTTTRRSICDNRSPSLEILNLLNGVELELKSRNRLQRQNCCTSIIQECESVVNKINHALKSNTTKHFIENKYTDIEFNEKVPHVLKDKGISKEYNNCIEKDSLKQNPSFVRDTQGLQSPVGQNEAQVTRKQAEPIDRVDSRRPEVKWHIGRCGFVPQTSFPIGYNKLGQPMYAGRTWNEEKSFLIPCFVHIDEGKCFYGKGNKLRSVNVYEIMECRNVAWDDAKGTPVTKLPQLAYRAGYNENKEPLYFGRAFIDGAITPGYIEERYFEGAPNNRAFALVMPFRDNVLFIYDTYEVMIVITTDRQRTYVKTE